MCDSWAGPFVLLQPFSSTCSSRRLVLVLALVLELGTKPYSCAVAVAVAVAVMAKGEDAVMRKKNRVNRKRMRNSESAVSGRIASIIASKRRRKAGKRRACEGMCFSLPTPEDPFNDRYDNKKKKKKQNPNPNPNPNPKDDDKTKPKPKPKPMINPLPPKTETNPDKETQQQQLPPLRTCQHPESPSGEGNFEDGCLSKFLTLCLNAIQNAWKEEDEEEEDIAVSNSSGNMDREHLLASSWGADLWRRCSSGWNVVDSSGACASKEQLAWLLSTASDIIARKEKQGQVVVTPFLLHLVPSQQKAVQVRSVCKPLKALGIHTVSLHPGASIDHQIHGLKSCEPEFLVSTPERLLELVQLRAIDISGVSLLVLDGLKNLADFGFSDKVRSIMEIISGEPQMVVFSDCCNEISTSLLHSLLKGPVCRLSLDDSVVCQSAFISQNVHVYSSEDERMSKALQILTQAPPQLKVLIVGSISNAHMLTSKLKAEGYAISNDPLVGGLRITNGEKVTAISVKDVDGIQGMDVEEFAIVIFLECPSIEGYGSILTKISRYSIAGAVHCFFSEADAPLAQPLIKVLEQCDQTVPESLKMGGSS